MKTYYKVIGIVVVFIVAFWLFGALLDFTYFNTESFKASPLFNKEEYAFRLLFSACFLAFGFIIARILNKQQIAEKKYRTLFESATDAIFIVDIDGNFLDVNRTAYERLGYTKEELLSTHISKLDPPEFSTRVPERFARIKERGVAVFESAHLRKDGTVMPVEVNARLLDYEGRKVFFSVVRDISERRKAEEMLRDSEQRFRAAFENAAIGASMADLKGRFIKINRFLCNMLGYTEEEMLSKTFSEVTHPDDVQIGLDAMKTMVSEDVEYTSFEKRYIRKDGQVIHLIISPAIIRDDDRKPLYFVSLFQDITQRKKAEEKVTSSLKEKEILLREVHHRVKNNMAIISALLQLQSQYFKNEEFTRVFKDSQNRIKSMALVHEKLYSTQDFAHIGFGDYVEDLARHLFQAYGKEVRLILHADDISLNIDMMVSCGLIINELITNSLKHAFEDTGAPEIDISLSIDDGRAVLVYADNGTGLPEHIDFHNSDTLGLQIINMLTYQLKGSIEVNASAGTTFTIAFELPRHRKAS
ncbi:MAG: PAS domain S-box protein [Nitrospirota bacterium]|jgi:PAS domain S-box-containing protein